MKRLPPKTSCVVKACRRVSVPGHSLCEFHLFFSRMITAAFVALPVGLISFLVFLHFVGKN